MAEELEEFFAALEQEAKRFQETYSHVWEDDETFAEPVTVSGIKFNSQAPVAYNKSNGRYVAIRPVKSEKTYLGLYIGEVPISLAATRHIETHELEVHLSGSNPAIYVFDKDYQRVVFGYESWWGFLEKPEDLHQITDADIQDIWYVKALQQLSKNEGEEKDNA